MIRRLTYYLAFTILIATSSFAGTIYENGSPNGLNGADLSNFTLADDFTLTSQATVSNFRFWFIAAKATDFLGTLSYQIFNSTSATPVGTPLVSVTATPVTAVATGAKLAMGGFAEYQVDVTLAAPLQLGAGSYWLGLHQGNFTTSAPTHIYWETTASQTAAVSSGFDYRYTPSTTSTGFLAGYTSNTLRDLAFVLNAGGGPAPPIPTPSDPGTPEPSSILLMFTGLAGMAWGVRRKLAPVAKP
jgi:hypothetical protein